MTSWLTAKSASNFAAVAPPLPIFPHWGECVSCVPQLVVSRSRNTLRSTWPRSRYKWPISCTRLSWSFSSQTKMWTQMMVMLGVCWMLFCLLYVFYWCNVSCCCVFLVVCFLFVFFLFFFLFLESVDNEKSETCGGKMINQA